MTQNLREQLVVHTIETLENMDDPRPVFVTREPFEADKLAITQFPAILVSFASEEKELLTMGDGGIKNGTITLNVRGFVRGNELDQKRNELITAIEEALETDRYRELQSSGVRDTQITTIDVVDRLPPLAEILISVEIQYLYRRKNP